MSRYGRLLENFGGHGRRTVVELIEERCVHDLLPNQCALCLAPKQPDPAPRDRPVWVLPTSEVFHKPNCYVFDATHQSNLVQGHKDSDPMPITVGEARDRRLRPCELCSPDVR